MASKLLSSKNIPQLSPILEMQNAARSSAKYAFTAATKEKALEWQKDCREALINKLGFLDTEKVNSNPSVIEEIDRGDFVRKKVIIDTAPDAKTIIYILKPKNVMGKLPVVIANHGHGYGVKDIVGLWEDSEERYVYDGYQKDFAIQLCRKGFMVCAAEIACFGERQHDYSYLKTEVGNRIPNTCHHAGVYAFMLGKSIAGLRVRDNMRMVDYISTLAEVDINRLGAMGISGGGMLTFFHTSVDERIKTCVINGYYTSFASSILAMNHCTCNYVPGILELGEESDLVGLIMPRPLLAEAGSRDFNFPPDAAKKAIDKAKKICKVFGGNPDDIVLDIFEGRHEINGKKSFDFLIEKLK